MHIQDIKNLVGTVATRFGITPPQNWSSLLKAEGITDKEDIKKAKSLLLDSLDMGAFFVVFCKSLNQRNYTLVETDVERTVFYKSNFNAFLRYCTRKPKEE